MLDTDGTLCFGGHTLAGKHKSGDFEAGGDIYRVKTDEYLTRIEKNGRLLFESVPCSTVRGFSLNDKACAFTLAGLRSTQVTMELEPEVDYDIVIDGVSAGVSRSNIASKLNFSVELNYTPKTIKITRL